MICLLLFKPVLWWRINFSFFPSLFIRLALHFFNFGFLSLPGHKFVTPHIIRALRSSGKYMIIDPLFIPIDAKYFFVQGKQQPKSKMLETAIKLLSRISENVSTLKKEEYDALRNSHAKGYDAQIVHNQMVLKNATDKKVSERYIKVLEEVREKQTKELLDEARSKEEAHVAECEKEKKRIHDEIAFFQRELEKLQQEEKSNQQKKTEEPAEVIEIDSE